MIKILENMIIDILRKSGGPVSGRELERVLESLLKREISSGELRRVLMKLEMYGIIRVESRKSDMQISLAEVKKGGS